MNAYFSRSKPSLLISHSFGILSWDIPRKFYGKATEPVRKEGKQSQYIAPDISPKVRKNSGAQKIPGASLSRSRSESVKLFEDGMMAY